VKTRRHNVTRLEVAEAYITRIAELEDALCAIYWMGGLSEEAERVVMKVMTPEQRTQWVKEHARDA
jgi:hypothetical protein